MVYSVKHDYKKVKHDVLLHEGVDSRFFVGTCHKCGEKIIKKKEDLDYEVKLNTTKKLSDYTKELPTKAGKQKVKNNYSRFERKTSEVDF